MSKKLKIIFISILLLLLLFFFLFCCILYLVGIFLLGTGSTPDLCNENINYKQTLQKNHNSYVGLIDYYLACGESCNIQFTGKGCGEGKQCYRGSSDEIFNEKIESSNIWSMKKINSNLIQLIPYDSIDNTSDHFGIGTRYLPCYRYLFIYNSSLRQKESALLLSRAQKIMDNRYVTLESN